MKRLISICLAVCLLLSLAACSYDYSDYIPTGGGLTDDSQNPTEPGGNDDRIITLTFYEEKGLNPYLCTDFVNRPLMSLLYQGLFSTNSRYETEPILCDRYTPSGDYKTHIFTVDPKATFSDGTFVTAKDVADSLNAAKESAYYKGRFLHITAITLSGTDEITITTDTEMRDLPILLDIPILPSAQLSVNFPIGSGPYIFEDTVVGPYLKKRTSWWCTATLQISTPAISLLEATSVSGIRDDFQFGKLDFAITDPSSDKYVDYRSDAELWNCESGLFLYIGCNQDSAVFDSPEIRAALTYAIDRNTLSTKFYSGFAESATLPASPHSPYYNKALAAKYSYNADKFKEAIAAAGKDSSSLVLLVNSDDALRLRAARAIADMLRNGGLLVEMKELGGSAYENAIKKREFDLYLGKTRLSPNMDLSAFFYTWGELSYGGLDDVAAYTLCLDALADEGNYYNLHRTVMDQGLLCPVLFCNYAVYTARGMFENLSPARDNVFCYSIGKTMENIMP